MATLLKNRTSLLLVAILLAAIWGLPAMATAADGPIEDHGSEGVQARIELPSMKVDIAKKTPEVVITNTYERFEVYDGTLIVGMDGKQVVYRNMLFPCKAMITFDREKGVRKAEKIQILEISPDATRHFFYEKPQ